MFRVSVLPLGGAKGRYGKSRIRLIMIRLKTGGRRRSGEQGKTFRSHQHPAARSGRLFAECDFHIAEKGPRSHHWKEGPPLAVGGTQETPLEPGNL